MSADGMDMSDMRPIEEFSSGESDERSNDDVSCSYEDMIYGAVAPVIRKAQIDITKKIAEKYDLSISKAEIESLCKLTADGNKDHGSNDELPSQFTGLKRKPSTSSSNGMEPRICTVCQTFLTNNIPSCY